jgi:hypothetical protein
MIVVGVILSFSDLLQPMISESDAYARVNVAISQKNAGLFFNKYGGTWLPFYFTIMSSLLSIFNYPLLVPRLVTLFFSLGSVIAIYFYTKLFTKNKSIALLSSLFLLLFPLRIYLGTQTLSEPIFVFFLLTSFVFIAKDRLSYKEIFFSLFFLNTAHGIRYESWMALPFIWFLIANKPISINKKLIFVLLSIAFPILWLYLNFLYKGSFLTFFNQKYEVAQNYIIPEYYSFNLSLIAWVKKLIIIFPISYLIISIFSLKKIFKQLTVKNIFYYGLPFFFFGMLVLQVFLGTMEWLPIRYLLIPTTFLIPLLSSSMYEFGSYLYLFFKKEKVLIKKIIYFSFILSAVFLFARQYFYLSNNSRLEMRDCSFLNSYLSYETIENSSVYSDFFGLLKKCEQACDDNIIFFYDEQQRTYLDQGLFYFLNKPGTSLSKEKLKESIEKGNVFVWERSLGDEGGLIEWFDVLYESQRFYLLKNN